MLFVQVNLKIDSTAQRCCKTPRFDQLDAIVSICIMEMPRLANGVKIPRTESVYKTITRMGPNIDSVILFASFKKTVVRFEPIFTPDGLCFTFNSLNSRDIYTDEYELFYEFDFDLFSTFFLLI